MSSGCLPHGGLADVLRCRREVAVVVVDVDQLGIRLRRAGDQGLQWLDAAANLRRQEFAVLVVVGVEHVDDDGRDASHAPPLPGSGRADSGAASS